MPKMLSLAGVVGRGKRLVARSPGGGNAGADMQGAVVVRSIVLGADVNFHFDENLAQ